MSKTINFKSNRKIIQEYLKSLEFTLEELKSVDIKDRFYFEMKTGDIFKPVNILYDNYIDLSSVENKTSLIQDYYILHSSHNKKLEDLDLDELIAKLSTYRCNQIEFRKILSLINKKRFAFWLEKIIRKLKKMLKLLNNIKVIIQNKREFFRKIYCFFFKNLDDTHATIIFN